MTTILALDAAWTHGEPSGVAVLANQNDRWNCLCVAPSYDAFLSSARGCVDWTRGRFPGSKPDVPQLLRTAESLAGKPVDLVAIDMPIATVPFSTRRPADDAISTAFGRQGCSAHSPSATRPGPLGAELTNQFLRAGFTLATAGNPLRTPRQLIEVYPHPALLALLRASYRIPYKVQKSTRYWPGTDTVNEPCACSRTSTRFTTPFAQNSAPSISHCPRRHPLHLSPR
jgi:predicted RNase H-like nuclease